MKTYIVTIRKPQREGNEGIVRMVVEVSNDEDAVDAIRAVDSYTGSFECVEAHAEIFDGSIYPKLVRTRTT